MLSCNPFMGGSAADFLCEFEDWFGGEHGSGRIKTGGSMKASRSSINYPSTRVLDFSNLGRIEPLKDQAKQIFLCSQT